MRVVVSCLQSLRPHAIPAYAYWREHFVRGIQEAGAECLEVPDVDWAEGIAYSPKCDYQELAKWKATTWQKAVDFILKQHRLAGVDLFLSYFFPSQVDRSAIQELKAAGIPCVNFYCDNIREFRKFPEEFRPFSLHWVPEFEAQKFYKDAGVPFLHAPMPCWVDPKLRQIPEIESDPPSFVGSADKLRQELFGRAIALGSEFKIFGRGWSTLITGSHSRREKKSILKLVRNQVYFLQRFGSYRFMKKLYGSLFPLEPFPIPASALCGHIDSRAEYERVTRESQITIGANRVPITGHLSSNPRKYSRLRDVEAPMMGACYLTERCPGLELLYEPGVEIECYSSPEELNAKLTRLLADSELRRRLRINGQKRALAEHTVQRTLDRIFTIFRS